MVEPDASLYTLWSKPHAGPSGWALYPYLAVPGRAGPLGPRWRVGGGSLQPAGPSWRRCQWSTSVLPDSPKANILPNCLSTFLSITTHSFTHTTLTLILEEQLERHFFPQAICRHHETSPFNTSACISQGQAHPPT